MKRCPFCGVNAAKLVTEDTLAYPGYSYVACDNCGARGGTPQGHLFWRCAHGTVSQSVAVARHDNEAIKLWDMRKG